MLNGEKYKERIKELEYNFALCGDELKHCRNIRCDNCEFSRGEKTCRENTLEWLLKEHHENILTDEEKIIIKDIIKAFKPFINEIKYVAKYKYDPRENEYVLGLIYDNYDFETSNFNGNKLFKGMEVGRAYTLEELGLC